MYGHVDHVAPLVDDAYHLLVTVFRRHTHQSAKLPYAEVYVHHIVARLHLLQFLHGERHLSRPCGIRAQVVFVETVEDLMVGEAAHPSFVVGKSFVEGLVDRCEGNGWQLRALPVVCREDVVEALYLFGAVGEHEHLVALQDIVVEGLAQQGEVLVEDGLRRHIEGKGGSGSGVGPRTQFDGPEPFGSLGKLPFAHELVFLPHLAHDFVALPLVGSFETFCHGL